jgi:transposase
LRPARRKDNRGRPRHDTRAVLNGVLWILGSGAQWAEMPAKYPSYQACHRRFQQWIGEGKIVEALRLLAKHLHKRGKLHLDEAFVDATFASAQKGALPLVLPSVARAPRSSLSPLVTVFLPLAVSVESASPAECRLVEAVLAGCFLDELPERLIGDKAYDSDALDQQMSEYGIEMISPNRSNRKHKTQDGRPLRRYRRRWKVERLFAWMQNYRRLLTRWEYHIENFLGFAQLACLMMLLKHLWDGF